jgi:hypothetical protein
MRVCPTRSRLPARPHPRERRAPLGRLTLLLTVATLLCACGAAAPRERAALAMAPLALEAPAAPLEVNHFNRDRVGGLSEQAIREILAAPVYLEERARVGVVPVATGYALDRDLPTTGVTGLIAERLTDAGLFEVVSEVTTDWPGTGSVAGLREIAARYRSEYLLLYRHRFVEHEHVNAWGWTWLAVLPAFFVPANTLEVEGVLEATLFDVKSGTLLFTVYQRVAAEEDRNLWNHDRKRRHQKRALLTEATDALIARIDGRLRDLVAARPRAPGAALALSADRAQRP